MMLGMRLLCAIGCKHDLHFAMLNELKCCQFAEKKNVLESEDCVEKFKNCLLRLNINIFVKKIVVYIKIHQGINTLQIRRL